MNHPRFHSMREDGNRSASQQRTTSSSSQGRFSRSNSMTVLTRPEADPRNWFLSSQRKEYNLTGKTRKEREQFQSIPAVPTNNFTPESTYGVDPQAKVKSQLSGLDACFNDTVRHINDFYFRPYVRQDFTRSALVQSHEPQRQREYMPTAGTKSHYPRR
ncbi:unnamed protein product [Amoebophrya sp. A120]|nr:unnamed protein product [Amoebophrya sp. A120]|eukprot:GSA120T00012754001.1